jgi:hypothetical protein
MPEEKSTFEVWIMRAVAGLMVPVLLSVPKVYMAVQGYEELREWKAEQVKKEADEKLLLYRFDKMEEKLDELLELAGGQP